MILGHTIALDPTPDQARHFRRACGTKRYAFNWGLAEWQRMHKAGEKPSMPVIKSRWNAPRFKKKVLNESFALWNDQFVVVGKHVRIAKLGWVRMREELRFTGKGLSVARWVCTECGTEHERDPNGAIVLRKLGLAKTELTRGDTTPLPARASLPARVVDEPRTETVLTFEHI